ncbi:MAG: hypothetical protein WBR10_03935 [Candidatus Acidiferrum sp.]
MNLLLELPGTTRARRRLVLSLLVALALWPFVDHYVCSIMQPPAPENAGSSGGATWDLRSM